jgi:hypothetical protein
MTSRGIGFYSRHYRNDKRQVAIKLSGMGGPIDLPVWMLAKMLPDFREEMLDRYDAAASKYCTVLAALIEKDGPLLDLDRQLAAGILKSLSSNQALAFKVCCPGRKKKNYSKYQRSEEVGTCINYEIQCGTGPEEAIKKVRGVYGVSRATAFNAKKRYAKYFEYDGNYKFIEEREREYLPRKYKDHIDRQRQLEIQRQVQLQQRDENEKKRKMELAKRV